MPSPILGAQQEVGEQDGGGGSGQDHEPVTDEEEAEHVVEFRRPDGGHDEVEFNEDGAKGEDAC
jgi:hypothetical protein